MLDLKKQREDEMTEEEKQYYDKLEQTQKDAWERMMQEESELDAMNFEAMQRQQQEDSISAAKLYLESHGYSVVHYNDSYDTIINVFQDTMNKLTPDQKQIGLKMTMEMLEQRGYMLLKWRTGAPPEGIDIFICISEHGEEWFEITQYQSHAQKFTNAHRRYDKELVTKWAYLYKGENGET